VNHQRKHKLLTAFTAKLLIFRWKNVIYYNFFIDRCILLKIWWIWILTLRNK